MVRRSSALAGVLILAAALLLATGAPAVADHTDPGTMLSGTPEGGTGPQDGRAVGEGAWEHVTQFFPNPGSDLFFWRRGGSVYAATGTLGQDLTQHVGQRIIRLTDPDGRVNPRWVADHGSARCFSTDIRSGTLGLQHDVEIIPKDDDMAELLVDSTDALGRCHDGGGGGLEFVDVSGIGVDPAFEPREVFLTRHSGTSHTVSVDDLRPWIVYNNTSDGGAGSDGLPWIELLDIRSCLTAAAGGTMEAGLTLEQKRGCIDGVKAYRIPFELEWSSRRTPEGELQNPHSCHDITSRGTRLYCAGLNATLVFDVAGMFNADGSVRGDPMPCTVQDAEPRPDANTGARVLNCVFLAEGDGSANERTRRHYDELGRPQAQGWQFLGRVNHAGRPAGQVNNNFETPSDQDVAISHQSDPMPRAVGDYLIVSDERGGGVVPGGASCGPNFDNPYGNGGLHVYDMSRTGPDQVFEHATMVNADGTESPAVWIGNGVNPTPTFCTVHVFHHVPDEQRIIMAYYTQGTKVLDYTIDEQGRFHFTEVASYILPGANTWTTNFFGITENQDGTRTYHLMASDIERGIDVFSWTHTPNPIQGREIVRWGGRDRIATAVEVSRSQYPDGGAETVFLARADDYADALAGAPLASARNAPILLTHRDRLPPATETEIARLGARRVVLLGGEAAITASVANALAARGTTVERVSGPTRFGTAAQVAAALGATTQSAFLAEGIHADPARGWPDALSAAWYAAATGRPILLTTRDTLPDETAAALRNQGVTETIVVGGTAAVSQSVVNQIASHGPRRLSGQTRYETSRAVYDEAVLAGLNRGSLWLATGRNWPDALTAGPVTGTRGDTLLLVDGLNLAGSPATASAISQNRTHIRRVSLLGGTAAVSALVAEQVRTTLQPTMEPGSTTSSASGVGGNAVSLTRLADAGLLAAGLMLLPAAALAGRRRRRRLDG